jgi:hypothetical protein
MTATKSESSRIGQKVGRFFQIAFTFFPVALEGVISQSDVCSEATSPNEAL